MKIVRTTVALSPLLAAKLTLFAAGRGEARDKVIRRWLRREWRKLPSEVRRPYAEAAKQIVAGRAAQAAKLDGEAKRRPAAQSARRHHRAEDTSAASSALVPISSPDGHEGAEHLEA